MEYSDENLDVKRLFHDDPEMLKDLAIYWPELKDGRPVNWLYEHEWNNHGTCYLMNMIKNSESNAQKWEQNPRDYKYKVMRAYFRTTIEKVKSLNVHFVKEDYADQNEFAKDIGF